MGGGGLGQLRVEWGVRVGRALLCWLGLLFVWLIINNNGSGFPCYREVRHTKYSIMEKGKEGVGGGGAVVVVNKCFTIGVNM